MIRRYKLTQLTVGLCGLIALSFTYLSVAGAGASANSGGTVQGQEGMTSPIPGASTGPTTGQHDDGKTGTRNAADPQLSHPDRSQQTNTTPRKSTSSHAERHPDYDRMDSHQQKPLEKESH